ncbi:M16 family metallopeptidase [Thermoproteota archaeon]
MIKLIQCMMIFKRFAGFILFLLLTFGLGRAMIAETRIIEHTLDNGLKVFLVIDPTASLVSVRTFVKAGSINESPFLGSGVSHYLEHMVASGTTAKHSEKEYRAMISKLGGAYNAYTTKDHTSYFINTIPRYLDKAVTILYEWMFYCAFETHEFERERKVITKEIEKNNADIDRKFYQLCQNNFYKNHPIRYPVIGYLANFKKLTRNDLLAYYENNYIPSNMCLVIGGNFNESDVLAVVNKTFGAIPNTAPPATIVFKESYPFSTRIIQEEGETHATLLSLKFATVDLFSKDLYSLDLMEFILGEGEDSLLYKTMIEDKKLAYSISCSSYTPSVTSGYFEVTYEIDDKNRDLVIKETLAVLDQIKQGRFKKERVVRAQKQKRADDIFSVATIEDKVSRTGQAYIYAHTADFYDKYLEFLKSVTKKDIVATAKKYLHFDKMIITILTPSSKETLLSTQPLQDVQPDVTPNLTILKNGVRVLLYPDASLPRVFAKVFVLGGLRLEDQVVNGLGHLTSSLLGKSSEKYSKEKIKTLIEDNGANMRGAMGNNTLYYSLDCLSEDFDTLTPLFFHSFLKPRFLKDDLEERKRKTVMWIDQRNDHWYSFCSYHFKKLFFKKHPYGKSILGEKDTIKKVDTTKMADYYSQLLNPKYLVVTVFGDFNEKDVLKRINKEFSGLKSKPNAFDPFKKKPRASHSKPIEIGQTLPQKDVAALLIGFDGSTFNNPSESLKLDLVDSVLTGMNYPGGRLHNMLREKGYVYVVHGLNNLGFNEKGDYLIYALTSPDKIEEVKALILEQIDSIKTKLVTKKEFEEALAQMAFYYKDRVASLENRSIISSVDEIYGRGACFYTTYEDRIKKLTLADVKETAKQFLINPQIYIFKPSN